MSVTTQPPPTPHAHPRSRPRLDRQSDDRFTALVGHTLFDQLAPEQQGLLRDLSDCYRLTVQEMRLLCEAARDLEMWREPGLAAWWRAAERVLDGQALDQRSPHERVLVEHGPDQTTPAERAQTGQTLADRGPGGPRPGGPRPGGQGRIDADVGAGFVGAGAGRARKQRLLRQLREHLAGLRRAATVYPEGAGPAPQRPPLHFVAADADAEVFGDCPVRSDRTLCCNLKTIDAVQNCAYGCSYCTIQTFYGDRVAVDPDLGAKLRRLELEPGRFYHIGSGQSSDSLVWGNRGGILDALCDFAAAHPDVLLELKTKSANVAYLLERPVPANVVCSWSLNTAPVIAHEEHFTAPLEQRLQAARRVADRGIKVAFHFHPMVHYAGWDQDYPALAQRLQSDFDPDQVWFVSLGSVTFIKPVIKQIRRRGEPTRILQTELVKDPHGKLTYPDDLKVEMFSTMYRTLAPWHGRVFFYLCMEKAEIWDRALGWRFSSNAEFERAFAAATLYRARSARALSERTG